MSSRRLATHRADLAPVTTTLASVGQVVFCAKPASGGAILAGLAYGDPLVALMGATGAAAANGAAKVLDLDADTTAAGLLGYNGCLVGCAFATFLDGSARRRTSPFKTKWMRESIQAWNDED